jgi:DNA ligase-1
MREVAKVIAVIGHTSGYNDKLEVLRKNQHVVGLKEILKFIYNPYCKTGISTAKLNKAMDKWSGCAAARHIEWPEAIKYFSSHQTGSDADLAYAKDFIITSQVQYGELAFQLAQAIVTQNLKIGVTATSLNNVYGKDFIPKTGCMLGTLFGDVGADKVAWPCIVTEKLDGVRRILVKENGVCRMYSRSGHEDEGLVDIIEEAKYLPNNYVYDGELLAKGTFNNSLTLRQTTNSLANCKGRKSGLVFNVFDMLPVEEFYAGKSKEKALSRKVRLGATFMDDGIQLLSPENWWQLRQAFGLHRELTYIKSVPILGVVKNIDEATPIVEEIWARGGEGIMLNTTSGLYEIKRSKQLLKVKHTEEYKLPIIDVLEGTGKYEDAMGAVVVLYKGNAVGVGSGFTDDQRREIWDNVDSYIGRKIEVETFGESTNAQGYVSLNCPIFKRFVGEVE